MRTLVDDTRGRVTILALGLGTVFLLALVVGFLADVPQGDVPPAYAACHIAWPTCAGSPPDNTRTSTLWVDHRTGDQYLIPVEPQTGENWAIAVYYSPNLPPCTDIIVSVSAAVDWVDGTGWTVSCTGCNALNGPVYSIGICNDDSCSDYNAWTYVLKLDLSATYLTGNLAQVVYTTSSVDNGVTIDNEGGNCAEDIDVSPTSQTWSQTDTTFPCNLNCDYDTTEVILYE